MYTIKVSVHTGIVLYVHKNIQAELKRLLAIAIAWYCMQEMSCTRINVHTANLMQKMSCTRINVRTANVQACTFFFHCIIQDLVYIVVISYI